MLKHARRISLQHLQFGAVGFILSLAACWVANPPYQYSGLGSWADPSVYVEGGVYYSYATNLGVFANVPMAKSTNVPFGFPVEDSFELLVHGFPIAGLPIDMLPTSDHPSWIKECTADGTHAAGRHIWGPEVVKQQINLPGNVSFPVYWLYFSAVDDCGPGTAKFGRHAIGVAWSFAPDAPVETILGTPVITHPNGVIDPEIVRISNTDFRLAYSVDWGSGGPTANGRREIRINNLSAPDTAGASDVRMLRANSASSGSWEKGVTEAPSIISRNGTWYLFYSGGIFDQVYQTNYATCSNLTSLCTRQADAPFIEDGWEGLDNPGGADLIKFGNDNALMFFHRDLPGGSRRMVMSILNWN